jgi:3-hydroxyisobutyrate dehydrogenase-like beta-hydroxyacid dehydrogenase
MARNLLRAGDEVRAWNRTQNKAEALADEGAEVVRTAPEVVHGAEFVLTMLADGEAVEETMIESRTLDAIPEDAVWIQSADTLGLDPQRFLEAISGGGSNMEYAHIKDQLMLNQDFPPSFPLRLARKDVVLILEAVGDELELPLVRTTLQQFDRAFELGHGDEDMSAVYYASAPAAEVAGP